MPKYEPGTKVVAFGKSLHAGHKGTVVRDYDSHLMLEAADPKYSNSFKSPLLGDGKYFQVDSLLVREIKEF